VYIFSGWLDEGGRRRFDVTGSGVVVDIGLWNDAIKQDGFSHALDWCFLQGFEGEFFLCESIGAFIDEGITGGGEIADAGREVCCGAECGVGAEAAGSHEPDGDVTCSDSDGDIPDGPMIGSGEAEVERRARISDQNSFTFWVDRGKERDSNFGILAGCLIRNSAFQVRLISTWKLSIAGIG
jgi:hypothetical protein